MTLGEDVAVPFCSEKPRSPSPLMVTLVKVMLVTVCSPPSTTTPARWPRQTSRPAVHAVGKRDSRENLPGWEIITGKGSGVNAQRSAGAAGELTPSR